MKLFLALAFTGAVALAPATTFAQRANSPVSYSSDAEQLAQGFAAAFAEIQRTPVYLTYERSGKLWTIVSVRSVRAVGGVVLVVTDKNLTFVINARDIIGLSDSPPEG